MRNALLASSVALLLAACGGNTPPPSDAKTSTSSAGASGLVTVEIHAAIVAPSKADGMSWDGVPAIKVPAEADAEVRKALAEPDGTKKVATILKRWVDKGIAPPEPVGTAQIFAGAAAVGQPTKLPMIENSFTPAWSPAVKIEHVKLDDATRLHVHLEDADDATTEPIGDVDLDAASLKKALAEKGQPYEVKMDPKSPHVLAVTIAVRAE